MPSVKAKMYSLTWRNDSPPTVSQGKKKKEEEWACMFLFPVCLLSGVSRLPCPQGPGNTSERSEFQVLCGCQHLSSPSLPLAHSASSASLRGLEAALSGGGTRGRWTKLRDGSESYRAAPAGGGGLLKRKD